MAQLEKLIVVVVFQAIREPKILDRLSGLALSSKNPNNWQICDQWTLLCETIREPKILDRLSGLALSSKKANNC